MFIVIFVMAATPTQAANFNDFIRVTQREPSLPNVSRASLPIAKLPTNVKKPPSRGLLMLLDYAVRRLGDDITEADFSVINTNQFDDLISNTVTIVICK